MAYSTGTVSTLNDLFTAIDSFITANGWTVLDTVSTRDKVYKSTGTDNKKSMVYRLTGSAETGYPVVAPARVEKFFPSIIARGYQRWSAGVGYNEYGIYGPRFVGMSNSFPSERFWCNLGDPAFDTTFPIPGSKKFLHSVLFDGSPINNSVLNTASTSSWNFLNQGYYQYDGIRNFIDRQYGAATLGYPAGTRDPLTGEFKSYATMPFTWGSQSTVGALVFNATTGNREFYFLVNTATVADQWWKQDLDTGAVTRLAQPLWAGATAGGIVVWDGGDYLYCLRGSASTDFARYSISGNSWLARAAAPLARTDFSQRTTQAAYIPSTASNIGEDAIYLPLSNSNAIVYRYIVTSNTWSTAITLANSHSGRVFVQYDGRNTMYVADSYYPTQFFHTNLLTAPNTTVQNVSVEASTYDLTINGATLQVGYSGLIRAHNSTSFKYWLFGDADGFAIATKVLDKVFWMYCGSYTTNYRQNTMKLSAPANAGSNVSISVDATAGYRNGDVVTIFDPASNKVEKITILNITNATTFVASTLANSYGTNSLAGIDPDRQVITGNSGFASCLFDAQGWRTGASANTYYAFPTELKSVFKTTLPLPSVKNLVNNARGTLLALKMEIFNSEGGGMTGINTNGAEAPLPTFERRGVLTNIYAIPASEIPAPQSEQVVATPDGDFLVLDNYPLNKMDRKFRLLFGPLP